MISKINEWMGQTPVASEHGELLDSMLGFVHWFMAILFVGWTTYMIYVIWRYRASKNAKADYHGASHSVSKQIEIAVVVVEAILLLGFAFPLWARQADDYPTSPDTIKMRALGEKFLWNFVYPGADGQLGVWNPRYIDGGTNTTGRDLSDPNGKDDFVNPGTMMLPVGRPVIVDVASKDVIHNLALVPMRAAQDAVPGVKAHMWFKPTKIGKWDIICGQLCGPGHANMKATIEVVPQEEFDAWMKDHQPAPAAAAPAAAPAPAAK